MPPKKLPGVPVMLIAAALSLLLILNPGFRARANAQIIPLEWTRASQAPGRVPTSPTTAVKPLWPFQKCHRAGARGALGLLAQSVVINFKGVTGLQAISETVDGIRSRFQTLLRIVREMGVHFHEDPYTSSDCHRQAVIVRNIW